VCKMNSSQPPWFVASAGACWRMPILSFVLTAWVGPSFAYPVEEFQHPRLFFVAEELDQLQQKRETNLGQRIWSNVVESARWCSQQTPRQEWIPTLDDDPQYENLYDRFYAAMHDTAIVEHLALTSLLSGQADEEFFPAARDWALAAAKAWRHEADNPPDASKAYAVLRVMKALAVAYDSLYNRLDESQRAEIRDAVVSVGQSYYVFFQEASTAGEGYNKHHGSVDAPPLGIMGLALLGDAPEAQGWVDIAVDKHVDYLLSHALTPSGTNEQSSNFWASTMQYRICFLEALRRVTGRELAKEFPRCYPGRIAMAAIAAGQSADIEFNEDNRAVLFGPSYGQINYWSPVLTFLAGAQQRPLYQHLAMWDKSLGSIQRTRYITPQMKEELLFCWGPYSYIWYDPSVKPDIEPHMPLSFLFPESEVNEAYMRDSYQPGGIVVGMKKGGIIVHAGGRPVLIDQLGVADINNVKQSVNDLMVADNGSEAMIRCVGPEFATLKEQQIVLIRPGRLTITREVTESLSWTYHGDPRREENSLVWPDGTRLTLDRGWIAEIEKDAHRDAKAHYAGMQYADPHPFSYPVLTAKPEDGKMVLRIELPADSQRTGARQEEYDGTDVGLLR